MARYLPISCLALLSAGLGAVAFRAPDRPQTAAPSTPEKVSYAEHVAPILNRSCVPCHRPGAVGPFSLVGYDNAKKWSNMVASAATGGYMPPWKAKAGFGEFLDENRLSPSELAILKKWYEDGAPRGDKKKEPKTPEFSSEWPLGKPDLVLQPSKPYVLDEEGADVYRNFVMKNEFKQPVWVKAMAIKPGNPRIVHHVITFIDSMGAARKLEESRKDGQEGYSTDGGGVGFMPTGTLGGWAPGVTTRETPQGIAYLVKPGSTLVLQVHYHKTGKKEEDLTRVGLYYAKEPIEKEMRLDWVFNFGINIPAGEKEHKESKVRTVPADVTMYGVMPHMHLLGRSMKADVEFPDGTVKPLVWVDDWDFNWQLSYAFKEPLKVPKGSKIRVEAIYDNSSANPRNPNNPPKTVTWGEQTTDEMFLMISAYTVDAEKAG